VSRQSGPDIGRPRWAARRLQCIHPSLRNPWGPARPCPSRHLEFNEESCRSSPATGGI